MPITYRIDKAQRVILTRITGVLTDEEIVRHKEELVDDPDFEPGMRELSDVRGVERLEVTPEGVKLFATMDEQHAAKLGDYRMAIVVSEDVVFGTARMYQLLTEKSVRHVQVFRAMDEARRWLGLAPEDR